MFLKTKSQINILGKVCSTIVDLVLVIIICCMLCSNNALASSVTIMPSQGPSETVIPQVDDPFGIINNPDFDNKDIFKNNVTEDPEVVNKRNAILGGNDPEIIDIVLECGGDNRRILELLKKAKNGGTYTIACYGGSITYGAMLGHEHERFGELVVDWFKRNFPKANFNYINSGLGASNTEMGCYRIERDLLKFKPDFVIVDFAVNTSNVDDIYGTYSTILYKILNSEKKPAVCAINFSYALKNEFGYYPAPKIPSSGILRAQSNFNIPTLNYHKYVWKKIMAGEISWPDFNADYIHPNKFGHNIAASLLKAYLQCMLPTDQTEPTPISEGNYDWLIQTSQFMNVGYITNEDPSVVFNEFIKASSNIDCYHRGWEFNEGGEGELSFSAPNQKRVGFMILFTPNAKGYIQVTSMDTGQVMYINSEVSDVLKLFYADLPGDNFKLTTHLSEGSFKIFGICVNYGS